MSNDEPPTPAASSHTLGYFTDATALDTGVPEPAPDPDQPPPIDTVDVPSAGCGASGGAAPEALRAAVAGDSAAAAALDRLTGSGRLAAESEAALAAFAQRPRAPALVFAGIDPGLILAELVRHLDNPLRVTQGRGRGTCGAATMEYLLLCTRPAELVRLVDGLTGLEGKATTRSGASLALPESAVARDDSGRVDLDRLLQSALMNHAATMSWLFDYDDTKDHNDLWSEIAGNSRVPLGGFASLYTDLTGVPHQGVAADSLTPAGVAVEIGLALKRGERVGVFTEFGPGQLHWLAVEKMDAEGGERHVYLRNPWGEDDGAGEPPRWPLPDGGGRVAMERDAFLAILRGAVLAVSPPI